MDMLRIGALVLPGRLFEAPLLLLHGILKRFGNNAKLRKDYCNVTPVVMYLRWVQRLES